jgi:filamentous hemagglutinin family protein
MRLRLTTAFLQGATAIAVMLMACPLLAQVTTDGSMGPVKSLSGIMEISNALGRQVGANLFHSFSVFNIRTGESVLFSSTFTGITNNVIGRITGPSASLIDGSLTCNIPGADLWLINPNGIAFGKNASVDVPGSFHASTADYLLFGDGKRFDTKSPNTWVLSVANPSAFGFLTTKPAPITVDESVIRVGTGKSLSLVGGDIDIKGGPLGILVAPGGRIDLVSVASPGEASLSPTGAMDVGSFLALGNISLSDGAQLDVSDMLNAGGSVYIRGGRFVMDNSNIVNHTGLQDSGPIDIGLTGDFSITGKSEIETDTYYSGRAGDIRISTGGDLTISDGSWIDSTTNFDRGDSGNIAVTARNVSVTNLGRIFTNSAYASGNAGSVSVNAADTVSISGAASSYDTGIASSSLFGSGSSGMVLLQAKTLSMNGGAISTEGLLGFGASGDLSVNVGGMELAGGALVSTSNRGSGLGGNLTVLASDHVSLKDNSFIQSTSSYSGPGGAIQIVTPNLTLDRSSVSTATYGSGRGGDIEITAGRITITSGSVNSDASLFSSGDAGNISITASQGIAMKNVGSTALDQPYITSDSLGSGDAGSITVTAPTIAVNDGHIETNTYLTGSAGAVKINVGDLLLENGGDVSSTTFGSGRGGTIAINSSGSISIIGTSPTTVKQFRSGIAAATFGSGNAGNISITTPTLDLDGGAITASTDGLGNAGNIAISVGRLSMANEANIQVASYGPGAGGALQIQASTITINGSGDGVYLTGISSGADGSGNGGDVVISADRLELSGGAVIRARSKGTGRAGSLAFDVRDALTLDNSSIQTSAELSAGGNVSIKMGGGAVLELVNSTITSSANGVSANDDGGNLTVRTPQFLILNNSEILARANAGNGGNITLGASYFVQSADSIINASSKQGLDGKIIIDSPNQVRGIVAALDLPSIDIAALLRDRCAAAALHERSSFTIEGLSGLPQRPGDFLTSPSFCFAPGGNALSDSLNLTKPKSSKANSPPSKRAPTEGD